MPITNDYLLKTLGALNAARPVTSKKMFGGAGLYCDGVFFALIDDDRLFFKVDESNLPQFDAYGAEPWIMDPRNPKPAPYREVPNAILQTPGDLAGWIDAAVEVAKRKAGRKR